MCVFGWWGRRRREAFIRRRREALFRSIWGLVRSVSQHLGFLAQRFAAFGFSGAAFRSIWGFERAQTQSGKMDSISPSALVKS
jgi:hypothetical protein